MINSKCIFTKISKSWTLMFNWGITVLAVLLEAGLQFAPEIRAQIPADYYIYFIVFVTAANKLLRAKTSNSLDQK